MFCADLGSQVTLFHRISRRTIARMLLIMAVALSVGTLFKFWGPQNQKAFIQDRQSKLQTTLDRFSSPIIVLGDSIVESSILPHVLCNHALINAGISGAQTTSGLGAILKQSLRGKRAALVILSL